MSIDALLHRTEVRRASTLPAPEVTTLPVVEALEGLLPEKGLRRGTTVGADGLGATSIALALAAKATHHGWCAAVGMPSLCFVAASEMGIDLRRLVAVPEPGRAWPEVVAALVDAFDVVLLGTRARPALARKLTGRVRERGAVLVTVGGWPVPTDLRLTGTRARWRGLDDGWGRIRSRHLTIEVTGRGAAAIGRRATIALPAPDGGVTLIEESAPRIARTG